MSLNANKFAHIIDRLLRNHIYKIIVIHWISYQPFEQPGPDRFKSINFTTVSTISKS